MKTALVQMHVNEDKKQNMVRAAAFIRRAAEKGAEVVVLPEMFNCPYQTKNFPVYAEKAGGACWTILSEAARENGVYLVGGSMPEKDDQGRVYNASFVFDRDGRQIARHRKAHLFDIDVPGGQRFKESETLTAGDEITTFDTEVGRMGLLICYDFRFPEMSRVMANRGAKVIFVPAAFNMTTGPAHWEILFRCRAQDYQVFTVGAAPARDEHG
ncbi:MAG: carbon-nitrogen hydrolase family protein, partial [Pyramidobacter sp.]|nr:carbon-nitrogen hydrolase family protein [Pyramidobacter sp.]